MENSEKGKNKKILKIQDPEMPASLVAYVLCQASVVNVCLEDVLEAQQWFLFVH